MDARGNTQRRTAATCTSAMATAPAAPRRRGRPPCPRATRTAMPISSVLMPPTVHQCRAARLGGPPSSCTAASTTKPASSHATPRCSTPISGSRKVWSGRHPHHWRISTRTGDGEVGGELHAQRCHAGGAGQQQWSHEARAALAGVALYALALKKGSTRSNSSRARGTRKPSTPMSTASPGALGHTASPATAPAMATAHPRWSGPSSCAATARRWRRTTPASPTTRRQRLPGRRSTCPSVRARRMRSVAVLPAPPTTGRAGWRRSGAGRP